MAKQVKVAIIGSGCSGLSAARAVQAHTDHFVVIEPTNGGLTCRNRADRLAVRALTVSADEYHKRHFLPELGVSHAHHLSIEFRQVMMRIRQLRGRFVQDTLRFVERLGARYLSGVTRFESDNRLRVNGELICADSIVLALEPQSEIPFDWERLSGVISLTQLMESATLPDSIAILGLNSTGLEVAQSLSRLGCRVAGFDEQMNIAGIEDPDIQYWAREIFSSEYPICSGQAISLAPETGGCSVVCHQGRYRMDRVLVVPEQRVMIRAINFGATGLPINDLGEPVFDEQTLRVGESRIFVASDFSSGADESSQYLVNRGRIAAENSLLDDHFRLCQKRLPLSIVFTDPQIARFGQSFSQLNLSETVIGSADFSFLDTALITGEHRGLVRLYADKSTRQLIGGEMLLHRAEHLAFELAICVRHQMTVDEILTLPFCSSTMEEGLVVALHNLMDEF